MYNVKNEHAVTAEIWTFTQVQIYICLHAASFNLTSQRVENPFTSKFVAVINPRTVDQILFMTLQTF